MTVIEWVRVIASLTLCLLVLPFGTGLFLCCSRKWGTVYFCGLMATWTLFGLLAMLFHATLGSLRWMTGVWMSLCVSMAVIGYLRGKDRFPWHLSRGGKVHWTAAQKLLLTLVLAIVAAQTLNTVFRTYYGNWDDETYCAVAVTSWSTDTVNRCSTTAGTLLQPFYNLKYVLASWPVYSAALAILSGLHPTVIYRTLLPLMEIPFFWWIGSAILATLFRKDRTRTLMAMLMFQLLFLVSAEKMTGTGIEWWIAVNCWTGKAVGGGVILSLILWQVMELYEAEDATTRADCWKILLLSSCAACFVSASLFFVVPVQLALWGSVYILFTRRYRVAWGFGLCMLPPLICATLTLF